MYLDLTINVYVISYLPRNTDYLFQATNAIPEF